MHGHSYSDVARANCWCLDCRRRPAPEHLQVVEDKAQLCHSNIRASWSIELWTEKGDIVFINHIPLLAQFGSRIVVCPLGNTDLAASYCSRAHLGMCSAIYTTIAFVACKRHIRLEHILGCARAYRTHIVFYFTFMQRCWFHPPILACISRRAHLGMCSEYLLPEAISLLYLASGTLEWLVTIALIFIAWWVHLGMCSCTCRTCHTLHYFGTGWVSFDDALMLSDM